MCAVGQLEYQLGHWDGVLLTHVQSKHYLTAWLPHRFYGTFCLRLWLEFKRPNVSSLLGLHITVYGALLRFNACPLIYMRAHQKHGSSSIWLYPSMFRKST